MTEPRGYARRFMKGSAIIFSGLVGAAVVALLLRMFLSRTLTLDDFGLFYGVFGLVSFVAIFRELGLGIALEKHIPEFKVKGEYGKIKSSISFVVLIEALLAFVIGLLLFSFAGGIASWILPEEVIVSNPGAVDTAAHILQILSLWFFIGTFYVIFSKIFLGFQEMLPASVMLFFNPLVFLFAFIFIWVFAGGVNGVAFAYVAAAAIMGLAWYLLFRRKHSEVIRAKAAVTRPLAKKLFLFALPVLIGGLGGMILGYMDTLAIMKFRTPAEIGIYNAALPAAHLLQYIPIALATVLFPMVSEIWAKGESKLLQQMLHFITKFSFVLIVPPALIFIAFPEIVLRILFGAEFVVGSLALQILSGAMILTTFYMILTVTMAGIGRPIVNTGVVITIGVFNLVGNLLLVPLYGIEGAAITTFASFLLGVCLMLYFSRKYIKFTLPGLPLLKTVVGGIFTLLLIFGLKSLLVLSAWPELFAVIVPSMLFYAIWILATRAITKDDLRLVKGVVPIPDRLVKIAEKLIP